MPRTQSRGALRPMASTNQSQQNAARPLRKGEIKAKNLEVIQKIRESITSMLELHKQVIVLIDGQKRVGKTTLSKILTEGSYGINPGLIRCLHYRYALGQFGESARQIEEAVREDHDGKRLIIIDGVFSSKLNFAGENCIRIWVDANGITRLWNTLSDRPTEILEILRCFGYPYPRLAKIGHFDFELDLNL